MTPYLAYRITCLANGKVYIGVTKRKLRLRWDDHKEAAATGRKMRLSYAIRKYGKRNFVIEEIARALSLEDLPFLERSLIAQYNSFNQGYNMTIGGDGPAGFTQSEEARQKLRKANTGRKQTPETIEKRRITIALIGPHPPKDRDGWLKNLRASHKRRTFRHPPEHYKRLSKVFAGRVFTPEWCAKISAAKKGKRLTAEELATRKRRTIGWKNPPRSPEHIANNVASRRANKLRSQLALEFTV